MTINHAHIAKLMETALFMLANAVGDVRQDRYSKADLKALGDALSPLVAALCSAGQEDSPMVIESERA